ncbi:MAG: NCS1 family nucleobase:cation symporter-1 [Xanthomonadales bacterium]|nr:NCS1 family nucleobase:cation symporter-1 [Xanthomonadales bacterium]
MRSKAMDYDRAPPVSLDLINQDLMPTAKNDRTWTWYHYTALWIGMVMCIPSYTLAAGLIDQGMSPWQAVSTVLLGNAIVLVPMLLIGHAGAKYGIPYAVLVRSSFGTQGAKVPALLRAIVACGWYGIQTWFGGLAIYTLVNILAFDALKGAPLPWFGIDAGQLGCFVGFWLLQLYFVVHGTESIRWLESISAPIKIVICALVVWWALNATGGFSEIMAAPSQFEPGGKKEGLFWHTFWPSLTAMVGFWATLALNIPDFTRFARSQRDQLVGQSIGLPLPMALLALMSVIVTAATVVLFGSAIWDPVELAGRFSGLAVVLALFFLTLDTMCCNLAANLVGTAYDFSNLSPRRISYRAGALITAGIALLAMPWKILASTDGYIFTWLIGYSALLGPVAGIMLVDYFMIRRMQLDTEELYKEGGRYSYRGGWNPVAFLALILGVLPNLPGFLHAAGFVETVPAIFDAIYAYAWFVGLFVAAAIYLLFSKREK